jgi:hypothetical protein
MDRLTPPGCVVLSALVLALVAAGTASRAAPALRIAGLAVAALLAPLVLRPDWLPAISVDVAKTLGHRDPEANPVVFSRWHPVFRVDVMRLSLAPDSAYILNHDGNLGSALYRFDGDLSGLRRFEGDARALPFRLLGGAPRVLVIGAAGGHEILASLYYGAGDVTAVELNPVTVSLLTDHFADYTGHLARHERVTLVNAEGRSFLRRTDAAYDLIWYVAPDSYAAMNAATSGAFVLSESYLYTVEAIEESLARLADGGLICAQFGELDYDRKPNRTLRYLATAREAFRRRGIDDLSRHVLVLTSPSFIDTPTILLKRSPFTSGEVERFVAAAAEVERAVVRYAPGRASDGPEALVVTASPEWLRAWYAAHPYDVRPVTDDSPFFWHFVRFRDALRSAGGRGMAVDIEDFVGERVLLGLLGFGVVFAGAWLLVPAVATRRIWREIPHKGRAGVYFAALGLGFMFVEVCMIQMLILLLGYPTHSLSVTLFALLIFTGLGSLASGAYTGSRRRAQAWLVAALAALIALYGLAMPLVAGALGGSAFAVRAAAAIAMIAPVGLVLGAFMPLGLRAVAAVSPHPEAIVAWSWAANGFCSVIGSVLSTVLAMAFGFRWLLAGAVAAYAVGVAALRGVPDGPAGPPRATG